MNPASKHMRNTSASGGGGGAGGAGMVSVFTLTPMLEATAPTCDAKSSACVPYMRWRRHVGQKRKGPQRWPSHHA